MAIRKDIVWTVAADGVTLLPAHPQDGGIQGEDKAVRIKFILGAEHPLVTGDYQIYIECVDATGGYDKTEVLTPDEEGAITALVPLAWTQYGGNITLSVVGEAEAQRIILDDAHLTFRSRPGMIKRMQLLIQTYIQKLLNRAESAVGVAEKAAASADESAGEAAVARDAAQAAAQIAADEANRAQYERVQVYNAADFVAAQKDEVAAAAQTAVERAFAAQSAAQAAATSASEAEADRASAGQILNRCREVEVDCEEYADDAKTAAEEAKLAAERAEQSGGGVGTTEYNRINVRDYGAVGDGITNDQPAIWKAITAAKALIAEDVPCELYFPAGTYGILEGGIGIKLPQGKGGLRIAGAGREITTIQYLEEWQNGGSYGNGWYALDISPEGSPTHWNYNTYIHDVAITGLTIRDDYPDKHATHTAKGTADNAAWGEENHGVNIGYCVRAAVTDCTLINLGDEVVDIYSCEDTIVMNNHIEGCPAAGPSGGAITIADGSKGAVVSGNTITRSGEDYVLTADDFDGEDGITLKAGVEMSGRVELPDGSVIARYTVLEQDTFIPVGTKIIKNNYGVAVESLYTPVSDVVITGNTIRDMHGKAMNLGCPNDGSSIDNVIIAENVMSGCDMGINFSGAYPKRSVKIQNNIISDCLNEAILTTAVEDITISGNTFRKIKGDIAVDTTGYGSNSRQLISENVFENIENVAVNCNGTTIIKDCLFNGVGTSETPLATKSPAIVKAGGTLTVSGCVMKDVRLKGVSCGIQNADYIEHTDIELVKSDGTINAGGDAIKGDATKRIIGGKMGGRIAVSQPNAIVQGMTIVSTNIGASALTISGDNTIVSDCNITVDTKSVIAVNANGVSVTGCNITITNAASQANAIAEGAGKNHNLFASNIVNRSITTVGAQSIAVNNIDTRVTA